MYDMKTTVNNVASHTWKSLRVCFKCSHHTYTCMHAHTLTMWGDGYVNYLDLVNHSTMYMYIKLSHCTLSTYTITFVNYFSITLVEGRGRVWEVFLYLELRKHSIIVCSSWRGRFQVSTKKKARKKFWSRECDRGVKEAEWIEMNRTEGTYMEETEEGRQSSDYNGNKDNDLKKMTFELTVKAGICNSKAEKKKERQTWENKRLHTA